LEEKTLLAKDMDRLELLELDSKNGFPLFGSIRLVFYNIPTLVRMNYDLIYTLGFEKAYKLNTRYAYEGGMATAINITNQYKFDNHTEALKAAEMLFAMSGWASIKFEEITVDPDKKTLRFTGTWRDSAESVMWHSQGHVSEEPMCHVLCSVISGYASTIVGQEVLVRESSCQVQGREFCRFEGRTTAEWGIEAKGVKDHFPVGNLGEEIVRLQTALQQANEDLERKNREIVLLRTESQGADDEIIARSEAMIKLQIRAGKVAPTKSTVLIQGESGTGKEVLARFIHRHSENREKPFLAINCAALPPALLESELFGHVSGAFTGADSDKKGLFVEAGEGTLFLDEIGELTLEVQAKLLRALQEREVRPVGGLKDVSVKARIIAATNRDLKEMIAGGRFREDLYYRLSVFPLLVPPLRERRQDILILARHFLARQNVEHGGFSPKAIRLMETYSWPGNVRELENWVEHAVILAGNEKITPEHFPAVTESARDPLVALAGDLPSYDEMGRRYVRLVLEHTGNNKSEASRILGIGFATLWRKLKKDAKKT
jgi:two-component system response regulator HydG